MLGAVRRHIGCRIRGDDGRSSFHRERTLRGTQIVRNEHPAEVELSVRGDGTLTLHVLEDPLQADLGHVEPRIEDAELHCRRQ